MADVCGVCGKPVTNNYVVIKDVKYHAECFKCKTCDLALGGKPYIQNEGDFLCQDCYYSLMGKKCGHCGEIIKGQYIEAMDQYWCPEHFVCATCGEPFPDDSFYKHNNHPYCEIHYRELTSEICAVCGEKILDGEMMEGGDKKYHMKCFVCEECKKPIGDGEKYHEYDCKLYCDQHLKAKLTLVCFVCGKPITGEYVMVGGKKMHKGCQKISGSGGSTSGGSGGSTSGGSGGPTSKTSKPSAKSTTTATTTTTTSAPSVKKKTDKVEKTKTETPEKKTDPTDESRTFYAYSSLTDVHNCPDGVKADEREQHLEDSEFEKLFGCSKATFMKLPKWKRKAKKQKLNLW